MIQLPQGFKIAGREAIDLRFILSKAEMLSMNDNTMPEAYFAICRDDGKMYTYQKTNEIDEETGKYRLYAAGSSAIVDKEQMETIVSSKENNILQVNEDGLYVEQSDPIEEEYIESLFKTEEENENG